MQSMALLGGRHLGREGRHCLHEARCLCNGSLMTMLTDDDDDDNDDVDDDGDDDNDGDDVDDKDLCKVKPADYSLYELVLFSQ